MFRLLFVLSTVVAIACGLRLPSIHHLLDGRIVGGKDTVIANYPYQISLRAKGTFTSSFSHSCGGSIYSDRVIITAAHCVSGRSASNLRIVVGVTSLKDDGELLGIERLIVNNKYSSSTIDNDVGLVILEKKLVYSASVQPIGLAEAEPAAGKDAIVTGWGTTKEGGSISNILQEVTVQIVDKASCAKSYASNPITDKMICAGVPEGGKDACQGDSGGPMVTDGQLVGIVSWGMGCARRDYPGVYSSVANLRDWIEQNSAPYL